LSRREKFVFLGFFLMLVVGSLFEAIGISLIFPFMQLISRPEIIQNNSKLVKVSELLGNPPHRIFMVYCGLGLLAVYVLKNIFFIYQQILQNNFLEKKQTSITRELLEYYLTRPLTFHFRKNSTDLNRNIGSAMKIVDSVWMPLLLLVSETLVLIVILAMLLKIQPKATLIAIFTLGTLIVGFQRLVRRRISAWTKIQFFHVGQLSKWVHQGFGGIKEIKVLGTERYFLDQYTKHTEVTFALARKMRNINLLPRPFLETLILAGIIAFVASALLSGQDMSTIMPSMTLFGIAAIRLMPSANRILLSSLALQQGLVIMNLVHESHLEAKDDTLPHDALKRLREVDSIQPKKFQNEIVLKGISYRYPNGPKLAIDNIDLRIARGETVAFVGASGAGKSTIVDVILGLLDPTTGQVLVDGNDISNDVRRWQRNIGYIPQSIFLSDDTIRRNIAFGIADETIREESVWDALKTAQLDEFVRQLPKGLETGVGERGVRLSGGQRQRIGIARALYHKPAVLILDEATSALDNETERAVADAVNKLGGEKTLIMIAHRLSTVANCDRLFFMREGKVIDSGPYSQLLETNPEFARFAKG